MHRAKRLLAVAVPAVLATVPVALAGPDQATGGSTDSAVSTSSPAVLAGADPAVAHATRLVVSVARAARAEAARQTPATIVRVRSSSGLALRSRPWGGVAVRVGATTEFGSARRLGVVRRRGPWLGVTTAALPNNRVGWIHRRNTAISLERTRWSVRADLSRRTVTLRRSGRVVRRLSVAVGRPGSPTPTGRFAVTDKLSGGRFGPYYGCCILALSATQPNTPPGWTGGNRMAIHGTNVPSSIGASASAGCLRAADPDLRFLIDRVPVGTPVTIQR
jgi:lipoprotein-anchoring transpeptidase ErfK/SrfK